jgi:hypothetical protein
MRRNRNQHGAGLLSHELPTKESYEASHTFLKMLLGRNQAEHQKTIPQKIKK